MLTDFQDAKLTLAESVGLGVGFGLFRHSLNKCLNVRQVTVHKDYPSLICGECVDLVNKFVNFRKVIINSDKDIRERVKVLNKNNYFAHSSKKNKRKTKRITETDNTVHWNNTDNKSEDASDVKNLLHAEDLEESEITLKNTFLDQQAIHTFKLWKCEECNESFTSRVKLKNHRRKFHVSRTVCNICGQILRTDNISKHIKLHSEGPIRCSVCQKVFKNSESLRSHTLIHQGTRYTCELCGKNFKVKSEHSRHMRCHADPDLRKTACSVCGKKVRDFKRHMLSHTGERPHLCTFCGRGFTSGFALKVHIRQHTNEKPYICQHCPCAFPQNVSLKSHIKSKHGIVT